MLARLRVEQRALASSKATRQHLVDGAVVIALGDAFHAEGSAASDETIVWRGDLRKVKWIGAGHTRGRIVVEGELTARDMPRLHYAGKYDLSQIPIIRQVTRQRPDVQNYDKAMEPKAMAIHPWGKLFISAGDPSLKDAQASALAKCNSDPARHGRDGGCFIYAVNNDVVVGERLVQPR